MKRFKNIIKSKQILIVFLILVVVISSMAIGYARYNKILPINGLVVVKAPDGTLEITDVTLISSNNTSNTGETTIDDLSVNIPINFKTQNKPNTTYDAVYNITLTNNSKNNSYTYNGITTTPTISNTNYNLSYTIENINEGDEIAPGESVTVKLTITMTSQSNRPQQGNSTITTESLIEFNLESNPKGNIISTLLTEEIDLKTKEIDEFQFTIYNTFSSSRTINMTLSNSNYYITDKNGNAITSFNIEKESTDIKTYYMKAKESTISTGSTSTYIKLSTGDIALTIGKLNIKTKESTEIVDNTAPQIGEVTINKNDEESSATINWSRTDSGGTDIKQYVIMLYKDSTLVDTKILNDDTTTYTYTDLEEGDYYAIVYGEDNAGNTGYDYISEASITNTNCRKSETTTLKWNYTVTYNSDNYTYTGDTTATYKKSYTTTITPNTLYSISSTSITMNGNTLSSDEYTTTTNNNTTTITIPEVTGDITIDISTSATCLVEGTKVKLYNGKEKNIEDIKYTDLLLVWNHDTDTFGYEYPAWIEESKETNSYTKITFSDGSTLNIVGKHSIFSTTLNKYVTINTEEFKIGLKVKKLDNNTWEEVTVTNIEQIKKEVKYYHIITTRYFNMITNNFLTTYEIYNNISNFHEFTNNMKWKKSEEIRKDIYTKKDLPFTSNYVFNTFRLEETKYLVNNNLIKKDELIKLINEYPMKLDNITKDINGNSMYMVTTSNDTDLSNKKYLIKENTLYTVPNDTNKTFLYWYNHSNNKKYYPGDKIKIENSMYLEAIYK